MFHMDQGLSGDMPFPLALYTEEGIECGGECDCHLMGYYVEGHHPRLMMAMLVIFDRRWHDPLRRLSRVEQGYEDLDEHGHLRPEQWLDVRRAPEEGLKPITVIWIDRGRRPDTIRDLLAVR